MAERRRYSSILAAFPWEWEGIVSLPQDLMQYTEKIPEYRHFIESLHRFESCLFSLRSSQAAADVLRYLGVSIRYDSAHGSPLIVSAHKKQLTAVEFQSIASVVTAYAFLETLLIHNDVVPRSLSSPSPFLYLPRSQTKTQDIRGMENISDLFDVLFDFRKIMGKLPAVDHMESLKSGSSHITLLRMVARSNTKNDYARIENNILHAALHMNSMKTVIFPQDQVPDLPKDVSGGKYTVYPDSGLVEDILAEDDTILNAVSEDPSILTDLQAARTLANVGPAMLRNAFQVASLLSPIFLFKKKQLIKMSLHRRTLLELAAKIRPCKPPIILKAEAQLWNALFTLVRGKETPFQVLKDLQAALPWGELEAAASPRVRSTLAGQSTIEGFQGGQGGITFNGRGLSITGAALVDTQTDGRSSGCEEPSIHDAEEISFNMPMSSKTAEVEIQNNPMVEVTPTRMDNGKQIDVDMQAADTPSSASPSIPICEETTRTGSDEFAAPKPAPIQAEEIQNSPMVEVTPPRMGNGKQIDVDMQAADTPSSASPSIPICEETTRTGSDEAAPKPAPIQAEAIQNSPIVEVTPPRMDNGKQIDVDMQAADTPSSARPLIPIREETTHTGSDEFAAPKPASIQAEEIQNSPIVEVTPPRMDNGKQIDVDMQAADTPSSARPSIPIREETTRTGSDEFAAPKPALIQAEEIQNSPIVEVTPPRMDNGKQIDVDMQAADTSSSASPSIPICEETTRTGSDEFAAPKPASIQTESTLNVADFEVFRNEDVESESELSVCGSTNEDLEDNYSSDGSAAPKPASSRAESIFDVAGLEVPRNEDVESESESSVHGSNSERSDQDDDDLSQAPGEEPGLPSPPDGAVGAISSSGKSGKATKPSLGKSTEDKERMQGAEPSTVGKPLLSPPLGKPGKPAKSPVPSDATSGDLPKGRGSKGSKRPRDDRDEEPIDVDQFYSIFEPSVVKAFVFPKVIDFRSTKAPSRVTSKQTFVAWDANGKKETFTPQAHYQSFLDCFATFMKRAEKFYVKGLPRLITAPDRSCIAVTTYAAYNKLDHKGKQQFLAGKTAGIVREWPVDPNLKFDTKGMRTLTACLTAPVDLQVYSAPEAEEEACPLTVTGKAQDLLDNAHEAGHIINGLDFPNWNSNLEPSAFAADIVAWEHTRGIHFSDDRGALYPRPDMNWSLAAHKWAFTNNHVDADGTFTKNLIGCGLKGWGFLVERPEGPKLSSIDFFLDEGFELSAVSEEKEDEDEKAQGKNAKSKKNKQRPTSKYDVEFVILRPGDMLLMKPNTPHFVITLDHSICYGGHSFSSHTMQQTLAGVIHTFVLHSYLTNAVHHPSRLLLRRILIFYYVGLLEDKVTEDDPSADHLPDYRNIDGLLDLLSVCVLNVLGNVLDFRTYSSPNQYEDTDAHRCLEDLMNSIDLNNIPENERKAICYARGVALHVMTWVRTYCTVRGPDGEVVEDLPSQFFVQIVNSTLTYKKRAEAASRGGGPHCTYERLSLQVSNVVASDARLKKMWLKRDKFPSNSLELAAKGKYSVEWQANWEKKWSTDKQDFLCLGTTEFDRKYFASYKRWCEYQVNEVLPKLGPVAKKFKRS